MKRPLFALVLLAAPAGAAADVTIPPGARVANSDNAYCVWCSVEMVGLANGRDGVRGLTDARRRGLPLVKGDPARVRAQLARWGVRCVVTDPGLPDPRALEKALAGGKAVAVGLSHPTLGRHMVALVGLDAGGARFVDPDRPDKVSTLPRRDFDAWFDGFTVEVP